MRKLLLFVLLLIPSSAIAQNPIWTCSLDNIGATLTQCQPAPEPQMRLYVTDIVATSTTATGGQMILQTGTGANCATGTASLLPSAASAVRIGYPAYTLAPTVIRLQTPLKAPLASALCVLAIATNTVSIQITGYVAP